MVGDCLQFFTRNTSPGTKALVKAWLLPVKRYLIALFQRNLIEIQYGAIRLFVNAIIGVFLVTNLPFLTLITHFLIEFYFSTVEEIGIHVHVFAGSLDELCSPCTSALLADTLKLGTLHLVRGVGHISGMMECWQVLQFECFSKMPSHIFFTFTFIKEAFILASGSEIPNVEHHPVLSV
jgi:hypothetical protein